MIFKTIEDELGKTKFAINDTFKGLFNGSLFKGEKLLSDDDIKTLQAYNAEIERGVSPMTAYYRTMQNASDTAVNMAQSAGEGTVQINNMTKASKAAKIVMQALSVAGNMFLGMAISWGASKLVEFIDDLVVTEEELNEQIEELESNWNELASTIQSTAQSFQSLKQQADDLIPKYSKLAQGVDTYGRNISLTDEEFKEFISLNNKLGDIFPELVTGYDANGNAILALSGNVDTLTESLYACVEAQRLASAQTIADTMPELVQGDTGIINAVELYEEQVKEKQDAIDRWNDLEKTSRDSLYKNGKQEDRFSLGHFRTYIRNLGISEEHLKELLELAEIVEDGNNTSHYNYDKIFDSSIIEDAIVSFKKQIGDTERKIESKWKQLNPVISAWLSTDFLYQDLDAEGQNIISSMIGEIDFKSLGKETDEEIKDYINNTIISPIYNMEEESQKAFFEVFDIKDALYQNEISLREYQEKINSILENGDFTQEFTALFKLVFDENELHENIANSLDSITGSSKTTNYGEYQNAMAETRMIEKYTKDFTQAQWENWFKYTEGIEGATNAINAYEEGIKSASVSGDSLASQLVGSKEQLESFTSSVNSAYDAYSKLMNPNVSSADILSSITELSELAQTMGKDLNWDIIANWNDPLELLGSNIEYISRQYAQSVLSGAGIENEFVELLTDAIIEAKKAEIQLDSLDKQIDSLQDSYKDMTDIIETYNKTGYITFDQLQTLLRLEPQYLACLVDENGQLSLNNEAMTLLAEQRLNDARAQIIQQAITELSELGYKKETTAINDNSIARREQITKLEDYNKKIAGVITNTAIETALVRDLNSELDDASSRGVSDEDIQQVLDNAYKKLKLVDDIGAKTTTNLGGIIGDSGGASDTADTFDWIEKLISRIQRTITNLGKTVSATYRNWSTRNNALAQEMAEVNKEINAQMTAYNAYMEKANSIGLSDHYKNLVMNGGLKIEDIGNEVLREQIESFQEYYEKALDCSDAIEDLRANLAELAMTKFDNISAQFDNQMSMSNHNISMLEGYISQAEAAGMIVSEEYYKAMIEQQESNVSQLKDKYSSLLTAFDEAVQNGSIEKYSEDWYGMLESINDVELEIQSATTELIEFNQALQQLSWATFDRMQSYIGNITSEAEFLIDMLDEKDLFDDKGNMTERGLAVQGLHAVNYDVYMAQAQDYADEIDRLNEEIANDPYDMELIDRRNELIQSQQDAIANAMKEKEAILSLIEEGYNKMLESLQELIDKRKEALQTEKSLYDYQNSISEKTDNIAKLRKQLQAYAGDNSESAKATIQELQTKLEEAEKDLSETEYEKYISDQEEMLGNLYSQTEDWVNERLDNIDVLLEEAINATNQNAETISNTIRDVSDEYSYNLTEEMATIWDYENASLNGITDIVGSVGDKLTTVNLSLDSIGTNMQNMINSINNFATQNANSIAALQQAIISGQPSSGGSTPSPTTPSNPGGGSGGGNSGGSGGGTNQTSYVVDKNNGSTLFKGTSSECISWIKTNDKEYKSVGTSGSYYYVVRRKYRLIDRTMNMPVADNLSYAEAVKRATLDTRLRIEEYASGTPHAKKGWAWVGEGKDGNEIILDKDGNALLTLAPQLYNFKGGEQVINGKDTSELLTANLMPLSAEQLWGNIIKTPKLPEMSKGVGGNVTNNNQFSFELPNVVDADSFITELQHSKRFEKIIDSMTAGKMMGKGSFDKFRF